MFFSSELISKTKLIRAGQTPKFPSEATTREYAETLDVQDKLAPLRHDFLIPTVSSLKKKALTGTKPQDEDSEPSIYLIGNSLGAQPKTVRKYLDAQLETWASIGVNGHFTTMENSPLTSWQDMAEDCARKFVPIVGAASSSEVVVMNTLTVNLHLMLASFYRPTEKRHKIIIEWKPFPSDWYAVQSQIEWHGRSPSTSMIEVQPDSDSDSGLYLSTKSILSTIDAHADSTALLLLPGIQYYTGQLLDMPLITKYAQERGIVVGWDLAHAVGNVELALHDWNVDFAVWCTYKYVNAGPGAIGGAFVHERHGKVMPASQHVNGNGANGTNGHSHSHGQTAGEMKFTPRLAGWYGNDKSVRFNMERTFQPTPGAQGWVISNPSAVDLASLSAALEIFGKTSMKDLRDKALVITGYAEFLLNKVLAQTTSDINSNGVNGHDGQKKEEALFKIITPANPLERGSQLSILLADKPGLLEKVSKALEENGVVCDKRKPNVIRIAPVPLYCTFFDVWRFVKIFEEAVRG
ncbi:pyridoxal phosphate-dependent transferase [Rhypophila decipiens]|uniref:Kynureninase n=1 Tax=Rhypophila decipiens TaxID=261697 RepID=A0AAN6XUD8_9PEZI|nr:pyridoxal phosphate-dependent transferase [Rhypophila decipiens]